MITGGGKKRTGPSEDTFEYLQLLDDKTSYRQAVFIGRKGAPSSQEQVTETQVKAFKIKEFFLRIREFLATVNSQIIL